MLVPDNNLENLVKRQFSPLMGLHWFDNGFLTKALPHSFPLFPCPPSPQKCFILYSLPIQASVTI